MLSELLSYTELDYKLNEAIFLNDFLTYKVTYLDNCWMEGLKPGTDIQGIQTMTTDDQQVKSPVISWNIPTSTKLIYIDVQGS